ncbi:MAG TPA: MFS transporter [Streptosporangiales bacterium]
MTEQGTRRREPAAPGTPTGDRWAALAVLSACLLLVGMDMTVLNVAVPTLTRQLLPSRVELLWILDAYSLAVAATVVSCGTLGDRIGRKRMLLLGFAVFGLASTGAAFAPAPQWLIVARVALGVGAAAITATAVAVIRVVFTDARERTLAIGLWSASHSVGAAAGPVLGGLLVEHFWWGSVFLVNVPVVAAAMLLGSRVIPESRDPAPRRWDPLSVVLSVAGVGGLVYCLKRLGGYGVETAASIVGLLAVAALVAFVRRQRRLAEPLLNLALFADRRFSTSVVCVLAAFGTTPAMLFLLTQRFQLIEGWSPLTAGLALVPWTAAAGLGGLLAPHLARRLGHRVTMTTALGVFAAAVAAVGLSASTRTVWTEPVLALAGLTLGVAMPLAGDTMMTAAPPERAGEAAAVQEISFELGAGLGIVVLGTVASITYRASLPAVPGVPPALRRAAGESLAAAADVAAHLPPDRGQALRTAAGHAFTAGLTNAALLAALGVAGAAVLCGLLLTSRGRS